MSAIVGISIVFIIYVYTVICTHIPYTYNGNEYIIVVGSY